MGTVSQHAFVVMVTTTALIIQTRSVNAGWHARTAQQLSYILRHSLLAIYLKSVSSLFSYNISPHTLITSSASHKDSGYFLNGIHKHFNSVLTASQSIKATSPKIIKNDTSWSLRRHCSKFPLLCAFSEGLRDSLCRGSVSMPQQSLHLPKMAVRRPGRL